MKTLGNNEGTLRNIWSVFEGSRGRSYLLLTLEVVYGSRKNNYFFSGPAIKRGEEAGPLREKNFF